LPIALLLFSMAAKQEIRWIGGYPFVVGVNAPKLNGQTVAEELKPPLKPDEKPQSTPARAGGHDLRGGHVNTLQKPAI